MITPSEGDIAAALKVAHVGTLMASPLRPACPVHSIKVTVLEIVLAPLVSTHEGSDAAEVPAMMATNTRSFPTVGVAN